MCKIDAIVRYLDDRPVAMSVNLELVSLRHLCIYEKQAAKPTNFDHCLPPLVRCTLSPCPAFSSFAAGGPSARRRLAPLVAGLTQAGALATCLPALGGCLRFPSLPRPAASQARNLAAKQIRPSSRCFFIRAGMTNRQAQNSTVIYCGRLAGVHRDGLNISTNSHAFHNFCQRLWLSKGEEMLAHGF
jgi:hypothetical protein